MLNILTGACTAVIYIVAGLFSVLNFLFVHPNLYRKIAENRKNDPDDFVPISLLFFLGLPVVFSVAWFEEEQDWGLYGLYAIAVLAGTNILSGLYEIGRWKRNKKAEEAKGKKDKVIEAAKEAPVSMDSFGSLYTEVDALPVGVPEKRADELLAKISAAHARGELTPTEFSSLIRMVYRRMVSA